MKAGASQRIRDSLGARLIALFVVLAIAVAVTFVTGMQSVMRGGRNDFFRPLANDYIDRLVAEIGTPPDIARAEALARRLPLRIRIDGPVVNWSSAPGDRHADRAAEHLQEHLQEPPRERPPPPPPPPEHANLWRPTRLLADGHRISFRFAPLMREEPPDERDLDQQRRVAFATLGVLLLLTVLAYAGVRHWLRPLQAIRNGAIRYGAGDFSQPIAPHRDDELGQLAQQIDRMAQSLHGMLDAKRGLLLAISHELRSPLTRARLNAELVNEGAARDALLTDLAEMRDLITDLLESERLAAGHSALTLEAVDLGALIGELLAGPFAGQGIRSEVDAALPLLALDRSRTKLLLRNLLDNAARHSPAGGPAPSVAVRRAATDADGLAQVVIVVRDHGPGVAEAHLPHLTEAFYRPDAARQRSTGGVGLGLHLCRLVAEAHGGQLQVRNAAPGLEVEVRLPWAAA